MNLMDDYERRQLKTVVPVFEIGDTIDVHVRIIEGDKQRVQIFTGTVIARKSASNRSAFTVRRIVAGEGVERVFPLHSPWIEQIVVKRRGRVRRAKLYYLRDRVGKSTKVRELIGGVRHRRKPSKMVADRMPAPTPRLENALSESAAEAVAGGTEK